MNITKKNPTKVIFIGSRPISVKALDIIEKHVKARGEDWIDLTVLTNSDDHPPKGVSRWWGTGSLAKAANDKGFKVLKSFDEIVNFSFDLGISVFSTDIIPQHIIENTPRGITNFHFGYLPTADYSIQAGSPHKEGEPFSMGTYRGSNVISHAILAGESWQAVTFHFISEHIDLGPVIEQQWNPISDDTTAWDLQQASEEKASKIFDKYFPVLIDEPESIRIQKPGEEKYPYYNRQSLDDIKVLPPDISDKSLDLVARALSFPNTEPPYFLEKNSKGLATRRYVIYKKGKGVFIMKPRQKTFVQKLEDIT